MNNRFLPIVAFLAFALVASVAFADPNSLVGKPAPDFTLQTLDGKEVKLSDQKGNVVVLDFWATWCPPCRQALPHLQAVSADKDLAEKGLKVFAVDLREDKSTIEKFMSENNYTFTVPMDVRGETGQSYLVRGIPTTFVVGRDGTVKNAFVGYGGEASDKRLDDAIAAALKEEKVAAK